THVVNRRISYGKAERKCPFWQCRLIEFTGPDLRIDCDRTQMTRRHIRGDPFSRALTHSERPITHEVANRELTEPSRQIDLGRLVLGQHNSPAQLTRKGGAV